LITSDQPLPQEVETEEEEETTEKEVKDQREEMEKEEASEVEIEAEEKEEAEVEEEETEVEEVVTEVEEEKEAEEEEVEDQTPLSELMPKEIQSKTETEEEEPTDVKEMKPKNTEVTTEEMEPVEVTEEEPREELVSSMKVKDQRPNIRRRMPTLSKLLKMQLLKNPRSPTLSQLRNTRKSFMVSLSMTTSRTRKSLELRKLEVPKVSAKTLRSRPTLTSKNTTRLLSSRTNTVIPPMVRPSSMLLSPWVSKLWNQKAKEEMKEEVAEEAEEEVAVVEELTSLEKQEVKDKTPELLSRRPKMTSQPYEQCDLFIKITKELAELIRSK